MKTPFFKRFMMPLAVMLFGFGLAFTTTSMKSAKVLVDPRGYRFVSSVDMCHDTKACTFTPGNICKSGSITLWGKTDPSDLDCPLTIYEKP